MRLFINALAATAGGGITYIRNVVPHLARRADIQTTVLACRKVLDVLGEFSNVSYIDAHEFERGTLGRLWHEQTRLPKLIRGCGADVLISAGNFALFNCPVPQLLLSRNALYTSSDFYRDLKTRGEYRLWLDTLIKGWVAKRSVLRAERTVAPSRAFCDELRAWMGRRPVSLTAIHHGFETELFFAERDALPSHMAQKLAAARGLRLLFVSHYNYFRNFDTLVRALPLLSERLGRGAIKLVLTCALEPKLEWGPYDASRTAELVASLGVGQSIVELGLVRYTMLHKVYSACDIYVTPAYAESFAHPLVEAMASGLPIVASDLPVHREICRDAAVYFPRFSAEALADRVVEIASSTELARHLSERGLRRSKDFSWERHVAELITLAKSLQSENGG